MFAHKIGTVRRCLYFNDCGKKEEYNGKRWKETWCSYKDNFLCHKHYNRLIVNPKRTKQYIKKYNDKRTKGFGKKYNNRKIWFLGKAISVGWIIRTGYCSSCPNNIFDGSCDMTAIHHWFYLPIMIWACTEEVCFVCHSILTRKLGQIKKKPSKRIPLDRKCFRCGRIHGERPTGWQKINNEYYCDPCRGTVRRQQLLSRIRQCR